jgi:hypothetical protein
VVRPSNSTSCSGHLVTAGGAKAAPIRRLNKPSAPCLTALPSPAALRSRPISQSAPVRCNAYAASDAECCREDTPISSLWNVSRSRLTARPAVVLVALRLKLSKPGPRRTCPLSPGVASHFGWFGKFQGRTEMVATPRRDLILSAATAGAAFGLDEAWQQPYRRQPRKLGQGLLPVHDRRCYASGCTASSTRITLFGRS